MGFLNGRRAGVVAECAIKVVAGFFARGLGAEVSQ